MIIAYQLPYDNLLIIKENLVYHFWDISGAVMVVDIFTIEHGASMMQKLIFLRTDFGLNMDNGDYQIIKNNYETRNKYPKVRPEQYLTHHNKKLRDYIKTLL